MAWPNQNLEKGVYVYDIGTNDLELRFSRKIVLKRQDLTCGKDIRVSGAGFKKIMEHFRETRDTRGLFVGALERYRKLWKNLNEIVGEKFAKF